MHKHTSHSAIRRRTIQACIFSLFLGVLTGLVVGGIMMSIAWGHNPQGEFHGYGTIHWGHWFLLGFLWFIPTCVVATLLYACFAVGTVLVISRVQRGFS